MVFTLTEKTLYTTKDLTIEEITNQEVRDKDYYYIDYEIKKRIDSNWLTFKIKQVAAKVVYKTFEPEHNEYKVYDSTDCNRTVLKQIFRNNKGYYYKNNKGYANKAYKDGASRIYLTNSEVSDLYNFFKGYNQLKEDGSLHEQTGTSERKD